MKNALASMGKIISFTNVDNKVTVQFENQKVVFKVLSPLIINVFVPFVSEEQNSKAIEGEKSVKCSFEVKRQEDCVIISTEKIVLKIFDDFFCDFYKADGTPLMTDYRGSRTIRNNLVNAKEQELLEAEGHKVSENIGDRMMFCTVKDFDPEDKIYGLGDKSGFLNKRGYEYENWNSDLPQVHTEDYHALYKSIPFMICLKKNGVYGVFYDNTFRSFFDFGKENTRYYFCGAENGNLDYYFIGGDSMQEIVKGYTYLTGVNELPMLWTLGYQQSRWGYESAEDMYYIAKNLRENKIPCDAIHFDIDYMERFKVFTWNNEEYEEPGLLLANLAKEGIKPVTIIDPGTKVEDGYFMYEEGKKNSFFATDKEGATYVNEVWPGDSVYPDFGRKEVRSWWGNHHKFLFDIGVKGIWNDMNEPASFRGEIPGDVVFHDEERKTNHNEIHNVYGHYMAKATYEGFENNTKQRPFIITRACYAGTQKYSTVWTGDNQSLWSHLQMMVPQLCNLGMSGIAFCGTDIGGFNADATPELLTRWVEAAIFSPLFRNHSARGTRRQEPWRFDDETLKIYRKFVELRYRFIPYIYDLFYKMQTTGLPIMRPLVLHYEDDPNVWNLNSEFLAGDSILVAPVLEQGATKRMVYLPKGTWIDFDTKEKYEGGCYIIKDAPIDVCPMFIKAGSIIPMYEAMQYVGEKPYDKLILLNAGPGAEYEHYVDNGMDYSYRDGKYTLYKFTTDENNVVSCNILHDEFKQYKEIEVVNLL